MQQPSQLNILHVEDDDIDAEVLQRAFMKHNISYPLSRARDGIEAFEFLKEINNRPKTNIPFIILLDLNMPRMNGHEFLNKLRQDSTADLGMKPNGLDSDCG